MKGEEQQVRKAVEELGQQMKEGKGKDTSMVNIKEVAEKLGKRGAGASVTPKDAMGLSDDLVEGIYGQAYRLYNTGKYKDAAQLFRVLLMLNSSESKYSLGLAACYHMMKEYKNAIETYMICGMIDPESPIPHYHASDCFLQSNDKLSAYVSLEMAIKRSGDKPEFQTLKDRAILTAESFKKEIMEPKEL